MNANDAVERLQEQWLGSCGLDLAVPYDDARAILALFTSQGERIEELTAERDVARAIATAKTERIDALTTELAAAKGERDRALARGGYDTRPLTAANVVGFTDCKMIGASGAHLTSEGEA